MHVVQRPCTLAQVIGQGMSEIVVSHYMPEWVHEAFQATVDEVAHSGNVVGANFTSSQVPLLAIRTVEHDVQVDKVKIAEGVVGARHAELVQAGVDALQLGLEDHDTARREVFGDDDLCERAIVVETLRNHHRGHLDELSVHAAERSFGVARVIRRKLDMSTVNELGLRTTKLEVVDLTNAISTF